MSLIALLPLLFDAQLSVSGNGVMMGIVPAFGLGLVLATCALEEQPGSRALVFLPLATLVGLSMAVLCWVYASLVGAKPLALVVGYSVVSMCGTHAFFALVRKLYDVKISNRKVLPIACASAVPTLALLIFPLTLYSHGGITAAWVACVGMGIAFISVRRKRRIVTSRKLVTGRSANSANE